MQKGILNSKKGSIIDIAIVAAMLLFFSIVVLVGYKFSSEFNSQVASMATMPTEAKTATATLTSYYAGSIDYGYLFFTIGIGIITLILASLVRIHPVFIPIYIIALLIVIILSAVFSNIYGEMAANSSLTSLADDLVFISHIMAYLPFIIGIFGTLLMVVMYKLWSVAQE